MQVQTKNTTVQQIFSLVQNLSLIEQCALLERLNHQIEKRLPQKATIDEAIALYLADQCSLGRAAELANVTRWDIIAILKKRNIPILIDTDFTTAEMDDIAEELAREGVLC